LKKSNSNNLKKNFYKIFLFHGVIKKKNYIIRNYTKKHILEKNFIDKIKFLKKNYNILSLDEIFHNISNKVSLPPNTCAITFDDGFENNYSVAAPILEKFKVPTTFYLSTDFINNNSMSWIDKIEYCFENTKSGCIQLPWKKNKINFFNKNDKILILDQIRNQIKKNFNINIDKFVKSIFKQCNMVIPISLDTELDKKLNWGQVKKLQKNFLFTIGGHSHNHVSLGSLSKKKAEAEINKSFALFKKKANIKLKHYSYPEGQKIDFNANIIKILKKKKILLCPSAISGVNNLMTDFFKLRRIMM